MLSVSTSNHLQKYFKNTIRKIFCSTHAASFYYNTPLVSEAFCAKNWQTRDAGSNFRSHLSTWPLGDFCGFFQNSRKCRLRSLRKIPTEGAPPIVQDSRVLKRTYTENPTQLSYYRKEFYEQYIHVNMLFSYTLQLIVLPAVLITLHSSFA